MMILISPAKKLDLDSTFPTRYHSQADFLEEAQQLNTILKSATEVDLQKLQSISPALAKLNVERNQSWQLPFNISNARPAIYTFQGDVYQSLNAKSLTQEQIDFAQSHLRILSGLYGILRPLDLIQPYRLEMGTSLKNSEGNDLYAFWRDKLTAAVNQQSDKTLINLASKEYFNVLDKSVVKPEIINIEFKEKRDNKYKVIGLLAKRARGAMARFIIERKIVEPEQVRDFNVGGYQFNSQLSKNETWVFTKEIK